MLITHERDKILNAVLYFAKNTKYFGKTKLCKLLFFADIEHFQQTGRTITGLDYFAWDFGPVPNDLYYELNKPPDDLSKKIVLIKQPNSAFTKISPKPSAEVETKYFTKREIGILKKIAEIYRDVQAKDISEISHLKNTPWEKTRKIKGDKARIDPILALNDDTYTLTTEEANEIIKERAELLRTLND